MVSIDGVPALERLAALFPHTPGEVYARFEDGESVCAYPHTQYVRATRGSTRITLSPLPGRFLTPGQKVTFVVPNRDDDAGRWASDLLRRSRGAPTKPPPKGDACLWLCSSHRGMDGVASTTSQWNLAMRCLMGPGRDTLCACGFFPGQVGGSTVPFIHTRASVSARLS